jgi:CheY-like chemotaxis protein
MLAIDIAERADAKPCARAARGIPVLKILVADDNSNIQRMVALAFAKRGIDVTAVGNGEAAVRRLADLSPDLVLADIFMPVRNGYEVCEYVKQDARFSHIPVILLVGAFDPLDEKEARRVGADGVLKKPFVPPDPLIAMVTSVLERNPRLAAELAIANRAAAEPPPPEALHPHVEAAPIPPAKFPEPSPQEATETYGFGTGRRAPEDRSKEAVGPTALAEEETQDEFDAAATTRDWRRADMDFEVSDEAAQRPAFSSDENLEPITFPLEREQFRVPGPAERSEPVAELEANPEPDRTPSRLTRSEARPSEPESAPRVSEAQAEFQAAPVVRAEPTPEPSFASRATEWMDMIASPPPEYPAGGWFARATSAASEAERESSPPASTLFPVQAIEENPVPELIVAADVDTPETELEATTIVSVPHPEFEQPSSVEQTNASETWPELDLQPVEPAGEPAPELLDRPSTDSNRELLAEPVERTVSGKDPELIEAPAVHVAPDPLLSSDEPAEARGGQREPELVEPPAVHAAPDPLLFSDEPAEARGGQREPELVEPPAVHVVPDPLLLEDRPLASSIASSSSAHSSWPSDTASSSTEAPVGEGGFAQTDPENRSLESSGQEVDERIPTGPPPDREVLAAIPFLSPPAEFFRHPGEASAVNVEAVDAIVRKVLLMIEPQLHELLSQGVLKSLVQNLLQSELEKKG